MVNTALDTFLQGESLVRASDDDDDLPSLQYRLDPNSQRHLGDFVQVIAEESAVGKDGVIG